MAKRRRTPIPAPRRTWPRGRGVDDAVRLDTARVPVRLDQQIAATGHVEVVEELGERAGDHVHAVVGGVVEMRHGNGMRAPAELRAALQKRHPDPGVGRAEPPLLDRRRRRR